MTDARRFSEDEVARIFEHATDAQVSGSAPEPAADGPAAGDGSDGMTLGELKEIGREVGIPDELIQRAASALDRPAAGTAVEATAPGGDLEQKFLGTRIAVGRTVELPRPLTEDEWARLVVDLRETFDARGRIRDEGPFKSWNNGNLQALLEPTDSGQRLRLRTMKGSARALMSVGASFIAVSIGMLVATVLTGVFGDTGSVEGIVTLGAIGSTFYLAERLRLPRWARTREQQMEGVAARLAARVADADAPAIGAGADGEE